MEKTHLNSSDHFVNRHIGPSDSEIAEMLSAVNASNLDELINQTVPASIRSPKGLDLPEALSEHNYLRDVQAKLSKNEVYRSFIGLGYYGTVVPSVNLRNILENPGWYTQYTPYQAEIAQGRLEALLNFQTMVSDLTGMPLANASLLDEGTAAAEAMIMLYMQRNKRNKGPAINTFLVDAECFPQSLDVIRTRAIPLGIEVKIVQNGDFTFDESVFACYLQYPNGAGGISDYSSLVESAHAANAFVIMGADLLALALLRSPGSMGADVVVGNTQRLGVPMFFGGPHAAYFATTENFKRQIPGRIIGVSKDRSGKPALRMALQTREQHIKREKATSNICTAQALLAIMAGMYAVYHGPEGFRNIATRVHTLARLLEAGLTKLGYAQNNEYYFDTLQIATGTEGAKRVQEIADQHHINFNYTREGIVGISIDETVQTEDLHAILRVFAEAAAKEYQEENFLAQVEGVEQVYPASLIREEAYFEHPVFNSYHSETEMMRYIKRLENKDLSLTHSMIALGSCTMKLNAASELMPLSWAPVANMHPFSPASQTLGYREMVGELETYLNEITGFTATSLQPNSGAQGEYTGLMVIRAYHHDRNDFDRDVALIPSSAHGTNPASAVMAGMKVVVVKCDEMGNIDVADLRAKAELHKEKLSCLMVTYPSTHGVFESAIMEICQTIHDNGGLVYMDGANMNAQVGLTSPAMIGADVCHLNLHKTFAIPHGGGGPGMGPICVNDKLAPFLPGHPLVETGGEKAISAVSAAPWGSASILLISYGYIRMLGAYGLKRSTEVAILNANYLKTRLASDYEVLYVGENGRVAHEFIIDIRPFKAQIGIDAIDVAKRLIDYGFHAPTVSFPVPGTMMIEPTESESKAELDRFAEAMHQIRLELQEVIDGKADKKENVLYHAPHTLELITSNDWERPYSREKAAFPVDYLRDFKFWPAVSRIDDSFGDRNLICTCPPIEAYAEPV